MPSSRIGIRSANAGHDDIIRLLHNDHERLLEEFQAFDCLESRQARQACQRLAQRTFAKLKVLADVEEHLFYSAVDGAMAGTDLIEQSRIEHARIHRLIVELESVEFNQADHWRRFRTLGKYVKRHVEDEEGELFPMLPCLPIDWELLYENMMLRRAELAEDLGVATAPPSKRSRSARRERLDAEPALEIER
jgi:hemerythrin superfamily protein